MSNEELVEELIPVASRLAGLVRDRDQPGVQHVLAKLPPHHKDGLLVVLAGMVNPERSPEQLLAWLHQPGISADEAAANRARLAEAIGEVDQERRAA